VGEISKTLKSYILCLAAEIEDNRIYVKLAAAFIIASYSIYLYLDYDLIRKLGRENSLFESLAPVFFLAAMVVYFKVFLKKGNVFILLLSLFFFVGAGEEISWGQKLVPFPTPKAISRVNVQHEFTIHNIEPLNSEKFNGALARGWARLTEINFLYKVFWFLFGVALPIGYYWVGILRSLSKKIKLPVPPLSVGIFFIINYLTMKTLGYFLSPRVPDQYLDTAGEIYECGSALIFLLIGLVFLKITKRPATHQKAQATGPELTP
jgi:hypothetical protein